MKKTLSTATIFLLAFSMFSTFAATATEASEMVWNINPTTLPNPIDQHLSIAYDGKIYVIGGRLGEGVYISNVYFAHTNPDGTVGSWTETTSLPNWRLNTAHVVWNNFVYVIGGSGPEGAVSGGTEQNTVYYAKITSNGAIEEWSETTSIPARLQFHTAAVWNGRIYVAGGWNGYGRRNKVYIGAINSVDGSIGSWTENSIPLPQAYEQMCALVHNGEMYMIGGWNGAECLHSVYRASISEADGIIGSWSETTPLPEARSVVRAVVMGGAIYVVGGRTGPSSETGEKTVYRSTIRPDGSLENWAELQTIPEARMLHSLVTLNDRLYVIGGALDRGVPEDTIFFCSNTFVPTPFWMQWWFWTIIGLGTIACVLAATTARYRKKAQIQKEPEAALVKSIPKKEYKVCPNCGAMLPVGSTFCGKCGKPLK